VAGTVDDDAGIRREQPIRANPAALVEAARDEVTAIEPNRVLVGSGLAGDLAQDDVVAFERSDDQRWPSLGVAEVREGEVEDYNITSYKLAQAASSSGASQSLAREDSAASAGMAASACVSLSARMYASSLSTSCSGM